MCYAGPGATNAIPGLAEAYVDSAIIVFSGQVDYKQTTNSTNLKKYKNSTAEIDIIPIVKPLTNTVKFKNPNDVDFILNKAIDLALTGRPGPK